MTRSLRVSLIMFAVAFIGVTVGVKLAHAEDQFPRWDCDSPRKCGPGAWKCKVDCGDVECSCTIS